MKKLIAVSITALLLTGCNIHTIAGTTAGGALGALGGSQFGKGKGRLVATALGTGIGAATLGYLGSFLDTTNHNAQAINQLQLQQLKNNSMSRSNSYYQQPQTIIIPQSNQTHSHQQSLNYGCSIKNNYLICNGN